jgi:hypothetical protein
MRAASGQQNANFGVKSEAVSGVGIQRLKVQGETATFHFPDNLARSLHDESVILIDLIPKVYDTQRVVRIMGIDGKESQAMLNPEMQQAHAKAEGDLTEEDVKEIFNPNVGRYDVVIDTGPSYQTQRQEGAQAMTELASKNPALLQIAGDIIMKAYDFPFSDQLAERLKKTLPPGLQEGGGKLPPEAQAQIDEGKKLVEQLAHALEACQKELDEAKSDEKAKFNEALIKAYEAETKRITALGAAMSPEQVQAMVFQTLQEVMNSPGPDPIPPDDMSGMQEQNEAPQGAFSLPGQEPGMVPPPEMAATGANPGLGEQPILPEGMQ